MIQRPKGTADILPEDMSMWHYIEATAREVLDQYRYFEIRTPMFESYELFSRGVGETTDVVTKEMYDFFDKGDRHIALKPEGTAPIVRAYVENKLYAPEQVKPYKVYYMGPMFRYERPQSGRLRQFHQIGVEVFGGASAQTDVETIALAMDLFNKLSIKNIKLVINTLGDTASRLAYREALIEYLTPFTDQLSEDSKTRLHKNPLRVLDSKDKKDIEIVANAPSILDFLSEESAARFERVQELLTTLGIEFEIDSNMVRGLDYYKDTIFEIMSEDKVFGAQTTICGGGNYTGLVEELSDGKESAAGFGFGLGIERLILLMKAQETPVPEMHTLDVYVVNIGDETDTAAMKVLQHIRHAGFTADRNFTGAKPKKQFRDANKLGAELVVTIGESELANNQITIKHMDSGKEQAYPIEKFADDFAGIYSEMTK
ncbi:histidine--tRNA ligase [Aerococcus agrisoli]|uniref:Histidine--tRNA ligase n=1 Tax=Aerococcus agrisoli TaxID=2487350 RepID=A0A3N4FZM4_9LACT|nr:histidine--tRNA ligase [Aerococcus agrisoli]RPA55548.1 histidine--tRNA ligase [Aerococcus agrisoli]